MSSYKEQSGWEEPDSDAVGAVALLRDLTPDDLKKKGVLVTSADGTHKGRTTGDHRRCDLEGCSGRKFKVKWGKGRPTWVCSKGLVYFKKLVRLME